LREGETLRPRQKKSRRKRVLTAKEGRAGRKTPVGGDSTKKEATKSYTKQWKRGGGVVSSTKKTGNFLKMSVGKRNLCFKPGEGGSSPKFWEKKPSKGRGGIFPERFTILPQMQKIFRGKNLGPQPNRPIREKKKQQLKGRIYIRPWGAEGKRSFLKEKGEEVIGEKKRGGEGTPPIFQKVEAVSLLAKTKIGQANAQRKREQQTGEKGGGVEVFFFGSFSITKERCDPSFEERMFQRRPLEKGAKGTVGMGRRGKMLKRVVFPQIDF